MRLIWRKVRRNILCARKSALISSVNRTSGAHLRSTHMKSDPRHFGESEANQICFCKDWPSVLLISVNVIGQINRVWIVTQDCWIGGS